MSEPIKSAPKRPFFLSHWRYGLQIDIAPAEIAAWQSIGLNRRNWSVLHKQSLSIGDLTSPTLLEAQLRAVLTAIRAEKKNISITLADDLVRMWIVTPPINATSLDDCEAAAVLRFQTLFGEAAHAWHISADWDARRPFLACAAERSLLDRIHAVCADFKLSVQKISPHFVTTWNRYRKAMQPGAWFGILQNDVLKIGALDQGRLVAVRMTTATYEVYQKKSWLEQHVQREALLFNLTPPKKLQICGTVPPQWQKNDAGQLHCYPLGLTDDARLQGGG
jgi:hypothetical protein